MGADPILPLVRHGRCDTAEFFGRHNLLPTVLHETHLYVAVTDSEVYSKSVAQLKLLRKRGLTFLQILRVENNEAD